MHTYIICIEILFQRYYSFLSILSDFTDKTNRLILIMLLDSVRCDV